MKPIIYNGEEYKDVFYASTTYSPSLKMRLAFLFCISTTVEHQVYTKEIMPPEKTICHVHIRSVIDKIKSWWWKRQGYNQMVAPLNESPCDTQSPE